MGIKARSESAQDMEVWVTGPEGANRLYICTGIATFELRGESEDSWKTDQVSFLVGPKFAAGQFRRAIAGASLAQTYNAGSWNYGGWRVNSVDADFDDESGRVEVRADVGVRDTDGFLHGIAYQVFILAAPRG